jgi:anthranilate synthase component 2
MRILLLDNYDSFTYNIYHYAVSLRDIHVDVVRNDRCDPHLPGTYDAVILSPGPGLPAEAGNMPEIINRWIDKRPFLGICLGHQAIAQYFGAELYNLENVYHGRESEAVILQADSLFNGIQSPFTVGRYHSWAVALPLPETLVPLSVTTDGTLMAFRHQTLPVRGVQFHPESVMTPSGFKMIENWIYSCK